MSLGLTLALSHLRLREYDVLIPFCVELSIDIIVSGASLYLL